MQQTTATVLALFSLFFSTSIVAYYNCYIDLHILTSLHATMNAYVLFVLTAIFILAAQVNATDDGPRRLRLRLPNANDADPNRRILQSSTMSMAIESIDKIGSNNMEVIGTIVSKLEEEGETVDPMLAELLVLAAVDEYEESAVHHHDDEYNFTKKCLRLLFIILPEYKAKKLSFICGETITTSTTQAMTTSTTAACVSGNGPCSPGDTCCSVGMYAPTMYTFLHCIDFFDCFILTYFSISRF